MALTGCFFVMESVTVSCEVGSQVLYIHCVKYFLNTVNKKQFFYAFIVKHWQDESFSWPLHTPGRKMLVRFSVNFTNFILNIFYFLFICYKVVLLWQTEPKTNIINYFGFGVGLYSNGCRRQI